MMAAMKSSGVLGDSLMAYGHHLFLEFWVWEHLRRGLRARIQVFVSLRRLRAGAPPISDLMCTL
jgi:hypothetical protein